MTKTKKRKKTEPNLFEGSYIKFRPADGEVLARFHIPDGIMDDDRFWILKAIDSAIFDGVTKALETHPIAKDALERYCALQRKKAGQNIKP